MVTVNCKGGVAMADSRIENGSEEQEAVASPETGWRSKVPIMACGAELFSDGYLNGVCKFI